MIALLCVSSAPAQNESKDRPPLQYQFDQNAISQKILANTDESVGQAVSEIRRLLTTPNMQGAHATIALRWRWGDQFLKVGRYAELLPLCKLGIFRMANERAYHASGLQRMRALCLLGLGRKQEALSHAKLYYNMCVTAETAEAVRLLIRCLREAHPDDAKVVEQFKAEQIAGAELTNDPPALEKLEGSVLAKIPLPREDAERLQGEIARRINGDVRNFGERTALGNFLLLAGRTEEARQVFEDTFDAGVPDKHSADALENVAIAIRACDGAIGRATAYILANQGETPAGR
jgi:hypothetical protein